MRTMKRPTSDDTGKRPADDAGTETDPDRKKRDRSRKLTPIVTTQRLLEIADVIDVTRLSERTIDRFLDPASDQAKDLEHPFPRPIKAGGKRLWSLAAIETWVRRMNTDVNPGQVA